MMPMLIAAVESPEDRDLMTVFYLRCRDTLYRQAQRYFQEPQDAEDIVHDALSRIIDNITVFRTLEPTQQLVYAKVTVRNLAYTIQKRKAYFDVVAFDSVEPNLSADENTLPENIAADRQKREKINSIWHEIDIEDRLLLEQKYILKWPDADLAQHLGIQPQSVRMRLTRAKRNIVRQMEEKGFSLSQW